MISMILIIMIPARPPKLQFRPAMCHVSQHLFVGCSGVMVGLGWGFGAGGRWEVITEEGKPI